MGNVVGRTQACRADSALFAENSSFCASAVASDWPKCWPKLCALWNRSVEAGRCKWLARWNASQANSKLWLNPCVLFPSAPLMTVIIADFVLLKSPTGGDVTTRRPKALKKDTQEKRRSGGTSQQHHTQTQHGWVRNIKPKTGTGPVLLYSDSATPVVMDTSPHPGQEWAGQSYWRSPEDLSWASIQKHKLNISVFFGL